MKGLSIKTARKILGKDVKGISDNEIAKDIETARLFADIFFDDMLKKKKYDSQTSPNVPKYGSIWKNEQ